MGDSKIFTFGWQLLEQRFTEEADLAEQLNIEKIIKSSESLTPFLE
jgi:hypothetical protein